MASCSNCHYGITHGDGPWCGWMGGDQEPDHPVRCHYVLTEEVRIPEGLVIANSQRVVCLENLSAENEAFSDVTGRGEHPGH
jgi:hypothetical protein